MSVTIESDKTKRFVEHSVKLSWIAFVFVIIAAFLSGLFSKQAANKQLTVSPRQTAALSPMNIQNPVIGALRIDVTAIIPANHWVVYEIRLYDDQNRLLTSVRQQTWQASRTWQEGGESVSWSESDLLGSLDVQFSNKEQEKFTGTIIALFTIFIGYLQTKPLF